MPYRENADLPPSVRDHLPRHAQDIFREAFNAAYALTRRPTPGGGGVPHRLGGGEAILREGRRRMGRKGLMRGLQNVRREGGLRRCGHGGGAVRVGPC